MQGVNASNSVMFLSGEFPASSSFTIASSNFSVGSLSTIPPSWISYAPYTRVTSCLILYSFSASKQSQVLIRDSRFFVDPQQLGTVSNVTMVYAVNHACALGCTFHVLRSLFNVSGVVKTGFFSVSIFFTGSLIVTSSSLLRIEESNLLSLQSGRASLYIQGFITIRNFSQFDVLATNMSAFSEALYIFKATIAINENSMWRIEQCNLLVEKRGMPFQQRIVVSASTAHLCGC